MTDQWMHDASDHFGDYWRLFEKEKPKMTKKPKPRFIEDNGYSDRLWCFVESVHYSVSDRCGTLRMSDLSACDMEECIALFERIDPDVKRIETWAGDQPDTLYCKRADGWEAYATKREAA